jgi:hypothetical protein
MSDMKYPTYQATILKELYAIMPSYSTVNQVKKSEKKDRIIPMKTTFWLGVKLRKLKLNLSRRR